MYTEEDVVERVKSLTNGEKLPVVYDSVGKTTFEQSLASLRPRGTLVLFGGASGAVPPFDLIRLSTMGSLYITRPTLNAYVATRAELESRSSDVFGWVADGLLKLRIAHTYPLSDVAQAHRDLEGRHTTGKLLLLP
jgi:NADPH2:quinone reductase